MVYIPECSRLSIEDYSPQEADSFDLTSYSRYYKTLWPNVIPGIVLGSLAAVGFIFSLLWLCIQCCRQRRSAAAARKLHADTGTGWSTDDHHQQQQQQQFIAGAQVLSDAQPPGPLPRPSRPSRPSRASRLLQVLIFLMALGLIGVCGWGMAVSIQETDRTVTSFWEVVDEADKKVTAALASLQLLSNQLDLLSQALDLAVQYIDASSAFLGSLGLSQSDIQTLRSAPRAAQSTLEGVEQEVVDGIQLLRREGSETIADLRADFFSISSDIEERWRFIPIAVVFGVTILCAALCCVLVIWMGWPRAASLFTALLWLMVALLMLLGVGLLRGVYEIGQDTCAYVEPFTLRYVEQHVSSVADRRRVTAALEYYFGMRDIPDSQVAEVLVGAPTTLINDTLQRADVQFMLSLIDPSGPDLVGQLGQVIGAPQQDITRIQNIPDLVPAIQKSVSSLEGQLLRPNIQPVYFQAKEWVCCEISGSAYDVWVAWTVAGCVGWVLCALCSIRVVTHTLSGGGGDGTRSASGETGASLPPGIPPPVAPAPPFYSQDPWTSGSGGGSNSSSLILPHPTPGLTPGTGPTAGASSVTYPPPRLESLPRRESSLPVPLPRQPSGHRRPGSAASHAAAATLSTPLPPHQPQSLGNPYATL